MSFILDTILTAIAIFVAYRWGCRRGAEATADYLLRRYPQIIYWEKLRASKTN